MPDITLAATAESRFDRLLHCRRIVGLNRDRIAADGGPQCRGRVEGHERAFVQDRDAIGLVGLFQQMRGQDDGDAVVAADLLQIVPQIAAGAGIEARARLVQQQ